MVLVSFLFPLLSLIFYRNSFPYYYVFILTPAVIVFGHGIDFVFQLPRKRPNWIYCLVCLIAIFLTFSFAFYNSIFYFSNKMKNQADLIQTIHKMFPKPVPYIDGISMVSSFPSAGFFMSSWGMESYIQGIAPTMKEVVEKNEPIFILANVPHLNLNRSYEELISNKEYLLLKEDWGVLMSNYIPHWGLIYVAGKKFEFTTEQSLDFDMRIPGPYTLETEVGAYIDGKYWEKGSIINLKKGTHHLKTVNTPSAIVLRWGKFLYKPFDKPQDDLPFLGPLL